MIRSFLNQFYHKICFNERVDPISNAHLPMIHYACLIFGISCFSGIVNATTSDTASVLCHVRAQTLFRAVEDLEEEADMK